MESLPTAPSCALDDIGLRAQYERYRRAGAGARVLHRSSLRLVVELDQHVDTRLVEQTIAIERECCPFYELGFEPDRRRLSVSVSRPEQAPALEAIAFALGLQAPVPRAATG
ncbi:MAG: hypothetical protein QOE67_251 [Solirubrobacteraceae bacterium]|jgi:hypothetical protein|nr:hypothetical protein [Solirubrobacteraceae bacterium]